MQPSFDPPTRQEILCILECLQSFIQNRPPEINPQAIHGLDWNRLIELAENQRISALLSRAAEKYQQKLGMTREQHEKLETAATGYALKMQIKKWQFAALQRLCHEQNISVIPYKGAALALTLYKDLPVRYMGDIDLFVREKDAAKAYEIFSRQGLERHTFPYPNRWQAEILRDIHAAPSGREALVKSGWNVDLHREARYHAGEEVVSLNAEHFWNRARPRETECGEVLFLDDADHALMLLFHAVDLFDPYFSQIVDIALLMKSAELQKQNLMERLPENLKKETRDIYERAIDAVEEFLSPTKRAADFTQETDLFFRSFFNRRKKTHTQPLSAQGWKRLAQSLKAIRGLRKKIIFIAGFFVPNPGYYHTRNQYGPVMYLEHWRQFGKRILRASFQRPKTRKP